MPGKTPETTPPVTVATEVLVLLQAPPLAPSVNVIFDPAFTLDDPLIVPATGVVFTLTVTVTVPLPQLVVPTTVYVVFEVGFALTLVPVVADKVAPGAQV